MEHTQPAGLGYSDALIVRAREAALRFLAYRPRSEAEVRRRLSRKFPAEIVAALLESLARQGLIDDRAFARQWRASREKRRPRSRRLIKQELRQFGVSGDVIAESLEGFDDAANAYLAGERPARRLADRGVDREEFVRRIGALLGRRGFGFGVIQQATGRLWLDSRPDALDSQGYSDDDEQQLPEVVEEEARCEGDEEGAYHRAAGNPGQAPAAFPVYREAD